jgi:hypothetical protein
MRSERFKSRSDSGLNQPHEDVAMSSFRLSNHGAHASRREILKEGGAALVAAAMLLASSRRALAKMTQKAALYQDKPKEGAKCAICENFQPPASCKIVAGKISSNGWCQMYIRKS